MQPPWSMAMSTITEPGFIDFTSGSSTSTGARPPGTSTAPISRSASTTVRSIEPRFDVERRDPTHLDLVDVAQPVDVAIEQVDLGLEAGRHPRRVPSDVARTQHHDPRRSHPGRPTQQHAAPAVVALEEVRADLRAHAAGDLAHRGEQGQRPVGQLHRLVGDADDLVLEQRVGHGRDRRRGGGR